MRIAFTSGLLLMLLAAVPCSASDSNSTKGSGGSVTLEPVVVTAEKRAQDAQSIPAGITVMDRGDIEDMKIDAIRDLADHVPNMDYHDFGSRRHGLLFMRGIKSLPGGQAGTGFTLDGLSYSKAYMFMGLPLFDVERIEVLRGAQGTLYGRNTTGGVINIHTADPGNEFASGTSVTYGNYGNKELRANVSGPLVQDKLYLGLYALAADEDSYMTNDVDTGGDGGRHKEGLAGRAKLMFTPGEDWETTLTIDGQQHDDGSFPLKRTVRNSYVKAGKYAADGLYHYSHDFESTEDTDTWNVNLNTKVDTGIGSVQSTTGYQNYRCTESIDADMSPDDALRKRMLLSDKDLSQEFRLASPEGSD
ncbi:MAG: TonB-dependent receptor plug domain-containing protein, partial [Pseudodesulfovibrio sp.]